MASTLLGFDASQKCNTCGFKASEENMLKHLKLHIYGYNSLVKCSFCSQTFRELRNYAKHRELCKKMQYGPKNPTKETKNEHFWLCPCMNCDQKIKVSGDPNYNDFKRVVQHLNKHFEQKKKVICPVKICGKSYTNYKGTVYITTVSS